MIGWWSRWYRRARARPPSCRIGRDHRLAGKVVWETSFSDTPDVTFTAAPLAIKDKIIVGAANGDQGVRDWIAGHLNARCRQRWIETSRLRSRVDPGRAGRRQIKGRYQKKSRYLTPEETYSAPRPAALPATGKPLGCIFPPWFSRKTSRCQRLVSEFRPRTRPLP
jgi:hypothetical protein